MIAFAPAGADALRAETLRVATFNTELSRQGPGLLLRDILRGDDPQVLAAIAVIRAVDADVLLLTSVDWDHGGAALGALTAALAQAGAGYPYRFTSQPNTGLPTGFDLDGNGRLGEARDAQGYGRFTGQGGMAILSRLPIDTASVRDFSTLLWRDMPGALTGAEAADVLAVQRLSTTAHWEVPLRTGTGTLRLLAYHATPPVFDGPEDRNGRRNHDESVFWLRLLDGELPMPPPAPPFVLLGDGNLDPADGDGLRAAMTGLLTHPTLQDPQPRNAARRDDALHRGDPALDTAIFEGIGGLRVDLVLPSADLTVTGSGVFWPPIANPLAATAAAASRHRLVWVDVQLP